MTERERKEAAMDKTEILARAWIECDPNRMGSEPGSGFHPDDVSEATGEPVWRWFVPRAEYLEKYLSERGWELTPANPHCRGNRVSATRMWQPIESAPKDGTEFLATDGKLLGVGRHYVAVEPETQLSTAKWKEFYDRVRAPFRVEFTANGLFPDGFDYLENCRLESEAWDAAKKDAPPFEQVPNPKAGQVKEWDYASAFFAFVDGEEVYDCDGPVGFTPSHWMPLPERP